MLDLLLALSVAPQAAFVPPAPPSPASSAPMTAPARCRDQPMRTRSTAPAARGLQSLGLAGGDDVALYRLLDRYVDGCPAPIVVYQRVPGSNAIGRVLPRLD